MTILEAIEQLSNVVAKETGDKGELESLTLDATAFEMLAKAVDSNWTATGNDTCYVRHVTRSGQLVYIGRAVKWEGKMVGT